MATPCSPPSSRPRALGPKWLTGGSYGPEAAFFTLIAILALIVVLLLVTRDYAWNYTYPPIIPGGYPVEVAAPDAHAAMEEQAQPATPALVQILPATPATMSVQPPPQPAEPQPVEPFEQSS